MREPGVRAKSLNYMGETVLGAGLTASHWYLMCYHQDE